ncbi:MAG: FHIPEP family type III secretion protein [Roseburia sp.]|nr:FHIPEP family type III secretion protein [Roseburia sp.]
MKKNIGDIISQTRQNKKMTQEEFASRLGVTPQAVSRWERGNGLPDISLVEGICKVLGISANTLLGIAENSVTENHNIAIEQEIKNNMFAEPLVLEFGSELIPCIAEGLETDYVNHCRLQLVKEAGMLMPILRLRDNAILKGNEVRILVYDKVLWEGELAEVTAETYQQIINQVVVVCKEHYATILNKQLVKKMVDNLKELYPGVADELVPEKITYLQLQQKLQETIREDGNIRDMIHILEELENCL